MMHDIISTRDLQRDQINDLISKTKNALDELEEKKVGRDLEGKVMATLFLQPSVRTQTSFEAAMMRLGGNVVHANVRIEENMKPGTFLDLVRSLDVSADVIVIRHPLEGGVRLAADIANSPVINAGDGANQHPSQALIDLYTIKNAKGKIDGISVGFVGDMVNSRAVRSLAIALSLFDVKLFFISPSKLRLPRRVRVDLTQKGVDMHEGESLSEVISHLDVLDVSRPTREIIHRFTDPEILDAARPDLAILHPFPHMGELPRELQASPFAVFQHQGQFLIPTRIAVLRKIFEESG